MDTIMTSSATPSAIFLLLAVLGLASCCNCQRSPGVGENPPPQRLLVSVPDQKMLTYEAGKAKRRYTISTSRFGVGDKRHSNRTPLGRLQVVDVIGKGLPKGMRLSSREPTGEIVRKNSHGYDPIVTRIVRLRGMESCNASTYKRCIYIHGTPIEKELGKPVSWGCVRMRSSDIVRLCKWVKPGAEVMIVQEPLPPRKCCTFFGRLFHGECSVPQTAEESAPATPLGTLAASKVSTAAPQRPAE
jgi:hypothetical protein